jgi:hypothetical protein
MYVIRVVILVVRVVVVVVVEVVTTVTPLVDPTKYPPIRPSASVTTTRTTVDFALIFDNHYSRPLITLSTRKAVSLYLELGAC